MNRFIFTVPGNPIPKARPRVTKRGHTYTPKTTVDAEKAVINAAIANGVHPLSGEVSVALVFYRDSRRRCDWDNLAKTVTDALNGVAYGDDNQITEVAVFKKYDADNPRTEVVICEVE